MKYRLITELPLPCVHACPTIGDADTPTQAAPRGITKYYLAREVMASPSPTTALPLQGAISLPIIVLLIT